jgi:DNA-binding MarR family transcriptional regulator
MSNRNRDPLTESLVAEMRRFIANAILTNQQIADQIGLNMTDQQALNLVDLAGSITPGELARRTGLTSGGVTVVLDRLEAAGYVKRERNPQDRRSVLVRPVAAKLRKVQQKYRVINEQLDRMFADYKQHDLEIVHAFFAKTNSLSLNEWTQRRQKA